MPPDPARTEDTQAWFGKAAQDLRRVDILLAADPPDSEGALFNIQQAAEKALKGFLTWHDIPFRKTHHLAEVGGQCAEIDRTLAPLVERADELTKYAWTFRYPGSPYEATLDEARAAAALAREVFEAVLNRMPPEIHPPGGAGPRPAP